MDYWFI